MRAFGHGRRATDCNALGDWFEVLYGSELGRPDGSGGRMNAEFNSPSLLKTLESWSLPAFDDLAFGLIVMNRSGDVTGYNTFESERAGIPKERVLGLNFFEAVGPCTNNYLIAQRFFDEPDLDDFLDYTFTLRMAPTPVRLRIMALANSARQYLAVTAR